MIIQFDQLPNIRQATAKRIVIAFGAFDIIHPGHIKYLEWAKQQGDVLVVSLKSDEQIQATKGLTRPIVSAFDRVQVIAALKSVDYALIGAPGDLLNAAVATAKALKPDVIVLGTDWGQAVLQDWQTLFPDSTVTVAPPSSDHSTSEIVERIRQ